MCFASASNGLALWLSEKTVRTFAELRIYTVSGKNVAEGLYTGDTSVMGLSSLGKPVNCIHTNSSHTCCSLMSVENK